MQLVPRAKRTRAKKGSKRIRVIGVGHENPQITVTIAITESGGVLPCQLIFEGKTTASLPCRGKQLPPDGAIFCVSSTHWQTVATYREFIERIIIPYRIQIIQQMNLPSDQKLLLKHDLHFTHTDEATKYFCEKNNIKCLCVPGRCTDELQECDTVINRPFKNGCKDGFVAYLHGIFQNHLTRCQGLGMAEADIVGSFKPGLTIGLLKPLLPSFVMSGMARIKTVPMSETIRHAFAKHGRFEEIRNSRKGEG